MPLVLPDDEHNRALEAAVHPSDWKNPEPRARYNLVAIGAGTAGLVSAAGAAGLGGKVALVEKHLMGGDCLNVGCVPSKGLIAAARAAQSARDAGAFGVRVNGVTADFGFAMERMRRLRAGIAHNDSVGRFSGLGIDVFLGSARFTGPDTIEVGGKTLRFARAVVATGGRAAVPPTPGLVEAGYLTNETVFSLTVLPPRLAVIGAGPIGSELAQAFRRLGSEVFVIDRNPRVLPRDDPDASKIVGARLEREGVKLLLGSKLVRVEKNAQGKTVVFERGKGEETVTVDEILVAAGRQPNVEGLGLEAAGIAFDAKGVHVDDHLRTTNPNVYAAGDVCSRYQFTHAADAMARIVLTNALFFGRQRVSRLVIPWCTYTDPEVAHVGLSAQEAQERGNDVVVYTVPLREVDRAVLDGEDEGFGRVTVERRSGRILGATLVAAHAGNMIGEMSTAITHGLKIGAFASAIHPYPTVGEVWKKLGDMSNRSRLTPFAKRVLAAILEWRL